MPYPIVWLVALCFASVALAQPVKVELRQAGDGYQLLRGGKPFYIKGAGGDGPKDLLVACGGNSFRTWGVGDDTRAKLDEAHRLGLAVTLGIWLGHERHGFDYNDADQVAEQFEKVRQAVERYKDHPAVLMWGIGNEMEGYANGDNAAIWSHVQACAALVKKLDPNHPTMTVVAELGGDRVKNIHRLCPDIDVVGINSYAGAASIPQRYRAAGGTKPYVVTEFGPAGTWESGKTEWGAVIELTSNEKAASYRRAYEALAADRELCLGSYAFTWGWKQEATSTWFGMFLPDGSTTPAVDAMAELWSGRPRANRAPRIESLSVSGSPRGRPGETVRVRLSADDPDGDAVEVEWRLHAEAAEYGTGGDAEPVPPQFPEAIVSSDARGAEVRLPARGGGYRLFAFVRDGKGAGSTANVPLFVEGGEPAPEERAVAAADNALLPFVVYGDGVPARYIPSGWMGDTGAIAMNEQSTTNPHAGATCVEARFNQPGGWGGVVWQHPVNDWGDQAGGFDLSGARTLSFHARGAAGGERVKFGFGLIAADKPYSDTGKGEIEVTLTPQWQRYTIDLSGKDLSRIKTGFYWVAAGQGAPLRFYLDDIRYE